MKYWEEYQSKWGFGDGDSMPPDAYAVRTVYCREINKLAKKKGSKIRLLAWDRAGMHNCYLIVPVPLELVARIPAAKLCTGEAEVAWSEKAELDGPMTKAIEEAYEMDLDDYIETTVRIRKRK